VRKASAVAYDARWNGANLHRALATSKGLLRIIHCR